MIAITQIRIDRDWLPTEYERRMIIARPQAIFTGGGITVYYRCLACGYDLEAYIALQLVEEPDHNARMLYLAHHLTAEYLRHKHGFCSAYSRYYQKLEADYENECYASP